MMMQRRRIAQAVPLSIVGSLLCPSGSYGQNASASLTPDRYASFDSWLEAARTAALSFIEEYGAENTGQFMQFLALWTTAMPPIPEPSWQTLEGANAPLDAATIATGRPFVVTALRFAPGCLLPAHCHPGGGGISLCTNGSLAIRHYDLVEGSPVFSETGAIADVEETSVTLLRQGRFTRFTPTDANLHQLQAGTDGATIVDLIVQWSRSGEFSFLQFQDDASTDQGTIGRRRSGVWVGMDISRAYPDLA